MRSQVDYARTIGYKSRVTTNKLGSEKIKLILTSVFLFVLWLLLSGIYDNGLIIGFGIFSSVLCAWIVKHLNLLENKGASFAVKTAEFAKYIFWLIVEIGKSDWAVTKVIVSKNVRLQQRLIRVPAEQTSDFSKVVFANSITITPGTVTVETETDHFIVHALTDEAADQEALANMSKRVSNTERGQI